MTEGAISNIFVRKEKTFFTPPVACGLLPGVYRGHLLKKDPRKYKEKRLRLKDLEEADAIYLVNSVRGMWRVELPIVSKET